SHLSLCPPSCSEERESEKTLFMLAARSENASEKWPSGASRRPREPTRDRSRSGSAGLGAAADAAQNLGLGHFFLSMPKTRPNIEKIGNKISREREESGKEGESASTGTTPAARAVRLRCGSAQQP